MAQIYRLFFGKPNTAWYQLSKDEQDRLWGELNQVFEQVGGKRIVFCDSSWSSERWQAFGVETFPDIEAEQKFVAYMNETNWFQYFDGNTILGTEMDMG